MHHVIIGNGPAGVIAAETIRKTAPRDLITLVGDEPVPPYSRMAIPYLLTGSIGESGTYLRKGERHWAEQRIELVCARAESIDTTLRSVRLSNGQLLAYDRLLIASGSRPVAPPIPGIDLPDVHHCWTLEDARRIIGKTPKGARVLQLGAGFIGCIIMESLAMRGVALTVVEAGNRMVPRMMTEGAGGLIRAWCERKGIRVHVNARAEAIENAGGHMRARLSNGTVLEADLIIAATGVKPNIGFLAGSGIACEEGVLVDASMQTNVPGVYAAGDVSQSLDFSTGKRTVNAIQPVAADEARVAALNMAGRRATSSGSLSMNVLDTLGLVSSSFGQWWGAPAAEGGDFAELKDEAAFRYLRLEFKDDALIGATALGLTEHVGAIRGLIQTRARLGAWKARLKADPTRLMEAYLATAQAASA
ncbi:MAG: NAD(P)/FAD-dependent oxidoreductase [Burkholderiales bacterium]|nr:NAD(P)/FAD-dependent oxidoreductase [Burkholderiales bacterium]